MRPPRWKLLRWASKAGTAVQLVVVCWACAPDTSDPETGPGALEELRGSSSLAAETRLDVERALRERLTDAVASPVDSRLLELHEASPDEPWEANVLLWKRLPDDVILALLREYHAKPYAVYGWSGWDHRMGAGPGAASESLLPALRAGALRRTRGVLCNLLPDKDPRLLLADLLTAEQLAETLTAGEPLVYALRVVAPAAELQRLFLDPRISGLQAAVKVNGVPSLPEIGPPPGLPTRDPPAVLEKLSDEAVTQWIRRILARTSCV